jgi:hypothetical protein
LLASLDVNRTLVSRYCRDNTNSPMRGRMFSIHSPVGVDGFHGWMRLNTADCFICSRSNMSRNYLRSKRASPPLAWRFLTSLRILFQRGPDARNQNRACARLVEALPSRLWVEVQLLSLAGPDTPPYIKTDELRHPLHGRLTCSMEPAAM